MPVHLTDPHVYDAQVDISQAKDSISPEQPVHCTAAHAGEGLIKLPLEMPVLTSHICAVLYSMTVTPSCLTMLLSLEHCIVWCQHRRICSMVQQTMAHGTGLLQ